MCTEGRLECHSSETAPSLLLEAGSLSLVLSAPNRLFICQCKFVALFVLSFASYCGVDWRSSLCDLATVSVHRSCANVSLSTVLGLWGLMN